MPQPDETALAAIWLPILIATVATMVLSTLAWTVLPHHKPDMQELPEADTFADIVESRGIAPGTYYYPSYGTPNEPGPRIKTGPWGTLKVYPCAPNMGRNIGLTFLMLGVIALFIGYLTAQACAPGADWLRVFQVATTAAVLCHVFGGTLNGIWFGKSARFFLTDAIDGAAYSAATGAIYATMWPAASTIVPAAG
ncbi:MAG: hypothetical protein AAGF47_08425 [Planctomycetota bacterium]